MTATTSPTTRTVALDIGGMTCASCAARITKRLNKLDGVEASVNYATEQATVTISNDTSVDDLVAQVEAIGYTATVPGPAPTSTTADDAPAADDPQVRALRNRLDRRHRARRPGAAAVDDQHAAVHQLAVAHPRPGRPGRAVGRLAVPPGRLDEPAPRRRVDGHPHLGRHPRRVRLERLRPVLG